MTKASAQITLHHVIDIKATYRYYLLQGSTLAKPSKPTIFPPPSGKNLISDDVIVKTETALYVFRYNGGFAAKKGITYTFSTNYSTSNLYVRAYNDFNNIKTYVYSKNSISYTPAEDEYLLFNVYISSGLPEDIVVQLEVGTEATSYEPYSDSKWNDTEPSYTEGSTNSLYFVDCTVFSDDTFIYSDVSLSSSYEAAKLAYNKAKNAQDTANNAQENIDNLEIGGRNLFPNSNGEFVNPYGREYVGIDITDVVKPYADTDQPISISADVTVALNGSIRMYSLGSYAFGKNIIMDITSDKYTRMKLEECYITYRENDVNGDVCTLSFYGTYDTGVVPTVKNVKVEIGTRCTDWTPAPEDIDQRIIDVSNETYKVIEEQSANITTACEGIVLESLKEYTKTTDFDEFKSVTESELSLIPEKITASVSETKKQIENIDGQLKEVISKLTKYFTFDIDGLTIGQIDSPFKVIIDNDRYSMMVNGVEVLWLNPDGKSNIPELMITKSLNLFGYVIDQDENGNVNCGYAGE